MRYLVLMGAFLVSTGIVFSKSDETPKTIPENLEELNLSKVGEGKYTWFGFSIYSASYWKSVNDSSSSTDKNIQLLRIKYQKKISSTDLVTRTLKEWKKLNHLDSSGHEQWTKELAEIWPDVIPGDTITTFVTRRGETAFYHNNHLLGKITDFRFGPSLLAIWLDEKSSAKALREKLLGRK